MGLNIIVVQLIRLSISVYGKSHTVPSMVAFLTVAAQGKLVVRMRRWFCPNCLPVSLRNESKKKFKQQLRTLLKQMLENEDDYIGVDKIISRMPYFQVFINTKTQ